MDLEEEISNTERWIKESNRAAAYGVCVLVGGAVSVILCSHYDLPTKMQAVTGVICGLIGTGMMTESNFFAARKHLQDLQSRSKEIK